MELSLWDSAAVGLRRVVDDRVVAGDDAVQQLGVADVAHHELHALGGQAGDVLGVAGVGELVQHRHVHTGVVVDHVVHEVGADEAAPAGDDDVGGLEGVCHADIPFTRSQATHVIVGVLTPLVSKLLGSKKRRLNRGLESPRLNIRHSPTNGINKPGLKLILGGRALSHLNSPHTRAARPPSRGARSPRRGSWRGRGRSARGAATPGRRP